jgi:hypothetical protein
MKIRGGGGGYKLKRVLAGDVKPNSKQGSRNQANLEIPEVFSRLYNHQHKANCGCEACDSGPANHNHPEKKGTGSKKTSRKGSY